MTTVVIIISFSFLLLYDCFAYWKGGVDNTISAKITEWAYQWPLLPFVLGFIAGHWFWQVHY